MEKKKIIRWTLIRFHSYHEEVEEAEKYELDDEEEDQKK